MSTLPASTKIQILAYKIPTRKGKKESQIRIKFRGNWLEVDQIGTLKGSDVSGVEYG